MVQNYDRLFHIQTRQTAYGFYASPHYHRYEATPYSGLELLLENLSLTPKDHLVDFGCGKGRLSFFFHYHRGIAVKGVEMDASLWQDAQQNLARYSSVRKKAAEKVQFFHCLAQDYPIDPRDDLFYFFNPFSVSIFMQVVRNILSSLEEHFRPLRLILYYPSTDYVFFLENNSPFILEKEIFLSEERERDPREKFQVWAMGAE